MLVKTTTCDRCGKTIDDVKHIYKISWKPLKTPWTESTSRDLCEDCCKNLIEFMGINKVNDAE